MVYHGRRGKRRWGRRYRRYRSPSSHRHVAEMFFRTSLVIQTPAVVSGFGCAQAVWNWNPVLPVNVQQMRGINDVPLFQSVVQTKFYDFCQVKAMKVKLWPWAPGFSGWCGAPPYTSTSGNFLAPDTTNPTISANGLPDRGQRGRGFTILTGTHQWDTSTGTSAPLPNNLDVWYTLYPHAKLRGTPDQISFTGKPCRKYFLHIPKEMRVDPWPVSSGIAAPPPGMTGATGTYANSSIMIAGFNYLAGTAIMYQMAAEFTWYATFYGRDAPMIS